MYLPSVSTHNWLLYSIHQRLHKTLKNRPLSLKIFTTPVDGSQGIPLTLIRSRWEYLAGAN
jgi:hypothetical protein